MADESNLVPPADSIFDAVEEAVGSKETAQQVLAHPERAALLNKASMDDPDGLAAAAQTAEGDHDIPLIAANDIGLATAKDVQEALHQVIDPELGIDVIDLGLVYKIEIDDQQRAIITMTLTTPACPLTDVLEDECASMLAGLVEEFRIDWTWIPRWTMEMITPDGRDQLAAIGFNFNGPMPNT
ncbi:metal-sulfur cluster assembly factor [Bifidobacterium aquikefiri]|uniref:Metal-sulfur cluster biosynthetic protein n=1 Tax=Bifidobacterium aquikefiri TaxID=1653207 RepID=A0A261G6A5_9BIFI|nr:metal-sulfur cluster assembly factor [Bifidobacterium aquikefiri]OZG66934.1 metal-sulfur cluster biosynthetic protein [Bifidobacterium aquikefiri]